MGYPAHTTIEVPGAAHPGVLRQVRDVPLDPGGVRAELLDALSGGPARPGHLCATAWVLSTDLRHTLLVQHPEFGWMPPGGHMVAGETAEQAAERELLEEAGVRPAAQHVLSVHGAMVPQKEGAPAHMHWTLGVANVCDPGESVRGEPGQQVCWWPLAGVLPESFFGDNATIREYATLLR